MINLQAFNSSYFCDKSYFEDDGTENYLVFQRMYRCFKKIGNTDNISADNISAWKSKVFSDESIKPPSKSDDSLALLLSHIDTNTRVKFVGSCLKQDKVTFSHKNIVNMYIVYEITLWNYVDSGDPTLGNSLLGAVRLVKNVDIDKYKYSGYGIGFDMKGILDLVKNVIIFGVDMSSSVHVDNMEKKNIVILGEDPTQGLDYANWL